MNITDNQRKASILIVDDEEVICEGLARLFSDRYLTYKARNGREAIDLLREHHEIDVVLCDIIMPEMDGTEVVREIRSGNKDIKMIIITAFSSPKKVCEAMRHGANTFLIKPLDLSVLEMMVRNAVRVKTPSAVSVSH